MEGKMPKRDPRLTPKAGDVLRNGYAVRKIIYVERASSVGTWMASKIQCLDRSGNRECERRPNHKQFHCWAKNAEVIHAAD